MLKKLVTSKNSKIIRRTLKVFMVVIIIAQLAVSAFYIGRWLLFTIDLYCSSYLLPKEERIFYSFPAECNFIHFVKNNLPEETNFLWSMSLPIITNYHIYPRKIYQYKEYSANEKIAIDRDFFRTRKIDYVFFDYTTVYRLQDVLVNDEQDPNKVIIMRR